MEPESQAMKPCDVGSITTSLLGAWCYPDGGDDARLSYMWFGDHGQAFEAIYNAHRPALPLFAFLLFEVESPTEFRIRTRIGSEGLVISFRWEGDELWFANRGKTFHCRRVADDEVPEWFPQLAEKWKMRE